MTVMFASGAHGTNELEIEGTDDVTAGDDVPEGSAFDATI